MNINELLSAHKAKTDECQKSRMACNARENHFRKRAEHYVGVAARMMQRADKCHKEENSYRFPDWRQTVLVPFLKELNKITGARFDTTDLRCFGLRCEVPVTHEYGTENEMSLIFTFEDERLYIDSGKVNPSSVIPGSIAEINRLHYITEEVTDISVVIDNLERRFPHTFKNGKVL